MKKLLAIMLSLTMVFSCLVFTACDNSADYKGDYSKEITADDLKGFIEKVNANTAIVQKADKVVTFGMDGGLDIEGEIAIDTMSLKLKTENDLKVRANFSDEKKEDSFVTASFETNSEATLKGEVPAKLTAANEGNERNAIATIGLSLLKSVMNKTAKEKASIILDKDGTVYVDGEASFDKALSSKAKIAVTIPQIKEAVQTEGVSAKITDGIAGALAMVKAAPAEVATSVIAMAKGYGIKIYFDGSNGYKFKIETTEETLKLVKTALGIKDGDKFNVNATAYLIFDDVCRLKCAKIEAETDFDFKLPAYEDMSFKGKFKAKLEIVANNSEISAPKNTGDYLKFEIPSFGDEEPEDGDYFEEEV